MDQLGQIAVGKKIKNTITHTHCELPQVNRCSCGLSQMLRTVHQLPFLLSTLGGLEDIRQNIASARVCAHTDISGYSPSS